MFFKKAKVPNLTDLLSDTLNKLYEGFVRTIFKNEALTSEQKVELATYLLFLHTHTMLVREVPADLVIAFPTNQAVYPMLTNEEKIILAKKSQERFPEYLEALTKVDDKDKVLNLVVLFFSHFYNVNKDQIAEQRFPQLMASELLSSNSFISTADIIDLCVEHNHVR